ncbi:MAG: DNA polymerase III subunit delta' [Candidatus Thiothrix moscowensis]|nr:DNA polymerase III subunit delta' [Candidatus Thiothrix moscowensis]
MIYPWQASVWESIRRMRHSHRLHHALLFTGENGCGNEDFIHALAAALLCSEPDAAGHACGHCRNCQVFAGQAHPDYLFVGLQEERQSILIEQIRELNHFLGLSRSYSSRRVAVISPADRMNINAANSLLKSLEEPADGTHILLLTAHPASLLPTIRSRCQLVRLPLPEHTAALAWLQTHALQHPAPALLETAHGRPLAALELDSTDMLTNRNQWFQHLLQMVQGDGNITGVSAHWEKFDKSLLLDWQLECLLGAIKRETSADPVLSRLQHGIAAKNLWNMHEKLLELKQLATHPLNPRLYVESMLMLWQVRH